MKTHRVEFQARIVPDFRTRWLEWAARSEQISLKKAAQYYDDHELVALHERIAGQVVTIVQSTYVVGLMDYF